MGISDRLHITKDSCPVQITFFPFTPCAPVTGLTVLATTSQAVPAWAAVCRGVSCPSQPRYGWWWRVAAGRASWNREIPAMKHCILPLVFAENPAENVTTCSCKDWIRAFYRDGVKKKTQTTFKIPICCWYICLPPSAAPGHEAAKLCLPQPTSAPLIAGAPRPRHVLPGIRTA